MKGTLIKTKQGWVIVYKVDEKTPIGHKSWWETLSLHPNDVKICNQYGDYSVDWHGKEVEFEIVTEWENGEVGVNGLNYAKLINHSVESNEMIDHIGEVNEMVESQATTLQIQSESKAIAELSDESWEGCDGCTEQDEIMYKNGYLKGYNAAVAMVSEEEIFKQAIKAMEEHYGSGCDTEIDAYFRGAKWIQEQLKQPKQ